ncbi:GntR family transcriptional regulator [Robbsia sp. KACC 23696]|uniref:GntR family transcriptional regulator n=1 Tax=Robbsia sp. KACC 23696 TaxID=3149231 RepID=UPI00325A7A13
MNRVFAPPPVQLDRSRHASPQVFEHLRERIIDLRFPPGMSLSRVELAAEFGVSQTPVREALLRLAEEKLVDVFPQHATIVRPIDIALAHQAHFLRLAIELEVVATLAGAPDAALLGKLDRTIEDQRLHAARLDHGAFVAADQAFHATMYDAAAVPDLFPLVRRQSGHLDRLRYLHVPTPGKMQTVIEDHAAILDAIRHGDATQAQHALRRHLGGTLSRITDIRARYPDYLLG